MQHQVDPVVLIFRVLVCQQYVTPRVENPTAAFDERLALYHPAQIHWFEHHD